MCWQRPSDHTKYRATVNFQTTTDGECLTVFQYIQSSTLEKQDPGEEDQEKLTVGKRVISIVVVVVVVVVVSGKYTSDFYCHNELWCAYT
jgi:hypothetical protein